jgi:hypothetical protein
MPRSQVEIYEHELEELWQRWDEQLALVPASRWTRRFGPDWTYADVPWHLAYFDRVMVADAIEKGRDLPPEERFDLRTTRDLNEWNQAEFRKRPSGTTPEQAIAELRRQRERIRKLLAAMTDDDLQKPAYNHFFGAGWSTVESALRGARLHAWSELFEFARRLTGRPAPVDPAIVHAGIASYMALMPLFADPVAAKNLGEFVIAWEISGPGGGTWTISVRDGQVSSREAAPARAHFRLRMDADTYLLMFKKLANPMLLMLTGKLRARPLSKLPTFGRLFADPPLDRAPDPRLAAAAMSA